MQRIWISLGALALLALPVTVAAQSTLIIRSDAACSLTVNAQAQGPLQAGTAKAVKTGGGEQLIEWALRGIVWVISAPTSCQNPAITPFSGCGEAFDSRMDWLIETC